MKSKYSESVILFLFKMRLQIDDVASPADII